MNEELATQAQPVPLLLCGQYHLERALAGGGQFQLIGRRDLQQTYFVTSDHLSSSSSSSSSITDNSGALLVNESFDAFGKRRGGVPAAVPVRGFGVLPHRRRRR